MKITAIKQQQKLPDRYSLFVDGKYKFSLTSIELSNLNLYVGKDVDEKSLEDLGHESKTSLAKNNSLRLLSYRPRSQWEIETYLKRKKYDEFVSQKTVAFLADKGFIDDNKFANQWVENRLLLKSVSVRQLRQELTQKHVAKEIIDEVISSHEIDEVSILRELIDKKRQQTKYKDDLKLMQYLARRGYSYENIKSALKSED